MKLFGSSCHFFIFCFSVVNFSLSPFYFVLLIFHHFFLNFWLVFFQIFFYTSSCNFSIFFLCFFFLLIRSSTSQIFSLKVCIISAFSLITLISLIDYGQSSKTYYQITVVLNNHLQQNDIKF